MFLRQWLVEDFDLNVIVKLSRQQAEESYLLKRCVRRAIVEALHIKDQP
jgi:hypothetical protein